MTLSLSAGFSAPNPAPPPPPPAHMPLKSGLPSDILGVGTAAAPPPGCCAARSTPIGAHTASTPATRSDTLVPHGTRRDRDCIVMPPGRRTFLLLEVCFAVHAAGEGAAIREFDRPEETRCRSVARGERRRGDRVARLDAAAHRQRKAVPAKLRGSRHLKLPVLHLSGLFVLDGDVQFGVRVNPFCFLERAYQRHSGGVDVELRLHRMMRGYSDSSCEETPDNVPHQKSQCHRTSSRPGRRAPPKALIVPSVPLMCPDWGPRARKLTTTALTAGRRVHRRHHHGCLRLGSHRHRRRRAEPADARR